MDPNNNQVNNAQQFQNIPQNTKNNKGIILLIIMLVLIVGILAYILFAKNQLNYSQKTSVGTSSNSALPTAPPISESPSASAAASQNDLNISSPDSDIQSLENQAQSL